jgi:hypothetical protein
MRETGCYFVLTIDTREPIELGEFVGALTSLGNQFERYIRAEHPTFAPDAAFYVKEIRSGSSIIEIIPVLQPLIETMGYSLIVEDFLKRYAARITRFLKLRTGNDDEALERSDLKDIMDAVVPIATDPDASSKLDLVIHEDGKRETRTVLKFRTEEARTARDAIAAEQRRLETPGQKSFPHVLMYFTRPDYFDAKIGKPSGERVRIDDISDRPLGLVYASEMAEAAIKHAIRDGKDNVFRLGFVVDVTVKLKEDKPVAYAVTALHQIIELPDGDETADGIWSDE